MTDADLTQRARDEAERRYPTWHDRGVGIVQASHWRTGFIAGAEWAAEWLTAEVERLRAYSEVDTQTAAAMATRAINAEARLDRLRAEVEAALPKIVGTTAHDDLRALLAEDDPC